MIGGDRASFLFLQGPPGPFFAALADGLAHHGHACHRINLNGGDWLDWRRGGATDFTGAHAQWPTFLAATLDRAAITDIVLFGDCRPLHAVARAIAAQRGIIVHVFEEGYIRPDWVTLERGGVNGHSSLPRDPAAYLRLAGELPPVPTFTPVPSSFRRRAMEALAYFTAALVLATKFPGHRSHRPHASPVEAAGWLYRFGCGPLARLRSATTLRRLDSTPYFLLPLQLDSDHQIRTHSPFPDMAAAIEAIIASFARHAPPGAGLLVKEHPLDNALRPWRRIVRRAARRHGASDRVHHVEHGAIDAMVEGAAGVVTVNSTTGTLALAAGIPVIVLGRAVYDLPGVTFQGGLDSFWAAPGKPQVEIYDAFRRVLAQRCLLRGGFSSVAGRRLLLPAAIKRLSVGRATIATAAPRPVTRAAG